MLLNRPNDKYYRWNPDYEQYEFWSGIFEEWRPMIDTDPDIEKRHKHAFISYDVTWAEPFYEKEY